MTLLVICILMIALLIYLCTRKTTRPDELHKRSTWNNLVNPQKRGASGTLYDLRSGEEVDESGDLPIYSP